MRERKQINGLLEMCKDLQYKVHMGDYDCSESSIRFSCDLLLRNMIMILELEENGENFTKELKYLKSNIVGTYRHITKDYSETTLSKYNLTHS